MPRIRPAAGVLLGVSALLTAMAWVPATALAQTSGAISIVSAGPDSSNNPYDLTVVADNTLGDTLTSMTVHLSQGSTDVYDINNMQPVDTTDPTNQTWQPAAPVSATALPAGTYTITVDATDTTGSNDEVDNGLAAGTIAISYSATTVSVTPSSTSVTLGSQSVTFSGTVTGTADDGNNTQVPIPGAQVSVSTDPSANITTDASGDFSYTDNSITQTTSYDFSVAAAGDGSYPAGDSGPIQIQANPATTSISVTPSETSISQGSEQIIFTGQVTAVPAGGGAPIDLSGVTVSVTGGGSSGQETTASDGSFSYEATGVSSATTFKFSVAAGPLYGDASTSVPIGEAAAQTSISMEQPSQTFVTQGATQVTFAGTVTVTPPGGGSSVGIGSGVPVTISVDGSVIATVNTDDASGDFSYTDTSVTQSTTFSFDVAATSLYGEADATQSIPVDPATTAITVTPSQQQIELGSQNVTFSGTVTMTPPGTTTPQNVGAGIPVTISGGGTNQTVTTDQNGDFNFPAVTGIPEATTYTFTVASATLYGGSNQTQAITAAQPAQSKITIPAPSVITFGSPSTTINGTVTGLNASSNQVPIAGASVYLNGGSTPVATTAANGSFSYQTPDLTATTPYTFSINADADNSLYTAASTPINAEFGVGSTTMSIASNPTVVSSGPQPVTFTGTVQVTPAGTGTTAESIGANVPVQVAINGGIPGSAGTTNANGVFTYSDPAAQPGNEYEFTVAGATYYNQATQDIAFNKESATLTVTPSQTTVTEGAQSVTFTGTATGMVPGGSTVFVSGAPVLLNGQAIPGGVTTDSNGKFSYTVSGIAKATSYDFSIAGTPTYTAATADIAISPTQATTRISGISISPSKLKYGQKTTLRGTVQYLSGTTWTNLGGTTVAVAEGTAKIANAKASTSGVFTATLPTTHGFGWTAMVSATTLTQQTTAIGNLTISVPMRVSAFGASLGVTGSVGTSGCLLVTAPVKYGPLTTVQVQYATRSRGPWHLLGRLQLHNTDRKAKGCSGQSESYFSGAIKAVDDNAYYRAVFIANDSFQGAVSKVIHSFRYATKITGYTVSPKSAKNDQVITMTGRLWHKTGRSWQPYANRSVWILYNEKGTPYWKKLGTKPVQTSSKGNFRQQAEVEGSNYSLVLYAEYFGSNVDLAARTPGVSVTIKAQSAGARVAPFTPSNVERTLSAQIAPPGAELKMLARQEELILGVTPTSIAIL
jgi:hypothetical protein